jgi:uncharacterized membrane protein YfcA
VPAILPGSISGAYRYAKEGLVNWRVGLVCGFTGGLLAALGAWTAGLVDAHYLMVATAGLMAFSGLSLIRSARDAEVLAEVPATGPEGDVAESEALTGTNPKTAETSEAAEADPADDTNLSLALLMVVGAGAGALAGLLGVGGGIVMVPLLVLWAHYGQRDAHAASLGAIIPISIAGIVTYGIAGEVRVGPAIALTIGSVCGARIGAGWLARLDERILKSVFGLFLVGVAVLMAVRG